ncbi:MAG: DUF3306 domain-containing protein [Betaproteobacteria bacterium]
MNTPTKPDPPGDAPASSLRSWSQRKHAARRGAAGVTRKSESPAAAPSGAPLQDASAADARAAVPHGRSPESEAGSREPKASPSEPKSSLSARGMTAPTTAEASAPALPPVHTLTPESDFTRFFDAKAPVDDALRRAALKKLLRDPRFNVMDGLDTYIDDYTRSDPIPESVLQRLVHAQSFVTPSATPAPSTVTAQLSAGASDPAAVPSHPPPADSSAADANATAVPEESDAPETQPDPASKPTTT